VDRDIDVNGVRLHCVVEGEGPLVLLLHGFPETSRAWRKQIPALAKRFRVVAPDLRGFGASDKPNGIAAYRTSVVAEDIVGLIRAFGADRAHVVGHDWGGGVAWALATLHPEAVDRLVVLNCPHPAIMQKALRSNWAQIRKSWYIFAFQLPWVPEWSFRRNGAKGLKDALRRTAAEHTINYCGQARSALPKQQTAGPLGPRTITVPPPDRACRMERSRRPRCSSGPKTISPSGSSSREGWTASSTIRLASNTYPTRATG
jgi:pimeloyl-ACP methyl ester carboxylesterase